MAFPQRRGFGPVVGPPMKSDGRAQFICSSSGRAPPCSSVPRSIGNPRRVRLRRRQIRRGWDQQRNHHALHFNGEGRSPGDAGTRRRDAQRRVQRPTYEGPNLCQPNSPRSHSRGFSLPEATRFTASGQKKPGPGRPHNRDATSAHRKARTGKPGGNRAGPTHGAAGRSVHWGCLRSAKERFGRRLVSGGKRIVRLQTER
jgi:hypothetical protein